MHEHDPFFNILKKNSKFCSKKMVTIRWQIILSLKYSVTIWWLIYKNDNTNITLANFRSCQFSPPKKVDNLVTNYFVTEIFGDKFIKRWYQHFSSKFLESSNFDTKKWWKLIDKLFCHRILVTIWWKWDRFWCYLNLVTAWFVTVFMRKIYYRKFCWHRLFLY